MQPMRITDMSSERRSLGARRFAALFPVALSVLVLVPALLAPTAAGAQTVDEILRKSLDARGGTAKVHAATTRRETGRLSLGAGSEWPFTVEHKRPSRLRMEIDLQGNRLIRVFDGVKGWQKAPQAPNPEQLTVDDLHNIQNEADFDFAGPLVDTTAKGKAELAGKEAVEGHDAYKVKVVLVSGDVFYYFLDATTYLPIHWEGSRQINGKPVLFEASYGDYRDVNGVKYPFLITSRIKGSANQQKITFSKIEVNVPIDDARFTDAATASTPAVPTAPTGTAAPVNPAAPAAPATPPTAPAMPMAQPTLKGTGSNAATPNPPAQPAPPTAPATAPPPAAPPGSAR
jgi:outer membrane lipoprotein-sorting protein